MKDEVLAKIIEKCKTLVGDKPVDAETTFEGLGAKSVDLVKMIAVRSRIPSRSSVSRRVPRASSTLSTIAA